jgi:gamma-aminobutyric acid type B receptor
VVPYPDNRTFAGWDKGFELIPAGHLATKHVNSNPDILPGYNLEVIDVPSEACGISTITKGLLEYYGELVSPVDTCVFGVVGMYCSTVTNSIAFLANHRNIGHVVLAASTSPRHRDVTALPYTFHTIASSSVFNEAMIAIMDVFRWKRVHIVHDSLGFYFVSTILNFVELIRSSEDKVITSRIPIEPQKAFISDAFDIINKDGARIGYFSTTEGESSTLFCEAYNRNFLWPGYVYILQERSLAQILSTPVSCSREQILKAVEGTFLLQYRLFASSGSNLVSGITYEQYHDEYLQQLLTFGHKKRMNLEDNVYANSLYDQVWAFALAANKSLGSVNFFNDTISASNHEKTLRNRAILTNQLKDIEFEGVSGYIKFGEGQEVRTSIDIYQVKGGEEVLIGIYDTTNQSVAFFDNFDQEVVPKDSFDMYYKLVPTWVGILVAVSDLILFTLLLSITISIILWRNRPEIKSASLPLSLIMLMGCYFLSFSVMLQTVRVVFIITKSFVFTLICNLELWLFINGINITFVTLAVRLFRISHVFRSFHSTGKYWSDKYLILYVCLICSVLVAVLVLWTVVDPLHHVQERSYIATANPPHYLLRNYCSSNSLGMWVALSLSFTGLVILFVIFLAIQTRHIKRKHFKDTKKVNMFIFSTCIIYAIFLSLWLILFSSKMHTLSYVSKCTAELLGATLCAALLFLPKIIPTFYRK